MSEKKELKFDIAVIDPNEDKCNAVVESVKDITADPENITKEELVVVSETRNKLVKMRTHIERVCKVEREEAKNYQKDVIAYENKLIGIIVPEEIRLKKIEADTKAFNIRKERLKTLPEYKQRFIDAGIKELIQISEETGLPVPVTDDYLFSLDPNARDYYFNELLRLKLEEDQRQIALQKAKEVEEQEAKNLIIKTEQEATARKLKEAQDELEKEKIQLEHEKELGIVKKEAQKQAQEDAKIEADRLAKEKDEAIEKLKLEQIEAKKKQEADEKYQTWLKKHGWTKETENDFHIENCDKIIVLYKSIATFKK